MGKMGKGIVCIFYQTFPLVRANLPLYTCVMGLDSRKKVLNMIRPNLVTTFNFAFAETPSMCDT